MDAALGTTGGPLSQEQVDHYWEHGYTVLPGALPPADLARWRERLEDIIAGRVEPAKRMLVMRDVMVVRGAVTPEKPAEAIAKIQDFENDPVLDSYNRNDRVLDIVEQLIGPNIQSIHCMLINKPPNVDGRHPLHQDLVYFPFRPADGIVATWTALEPVTRENGCLVVVPGTHKHGLRDHENMDWEHVNSGYWGVKDIGADHRRVHIECDPGDMVLFHPIILHGSGRNKTSGFRRAISCHYASTECSRVWQERPDDEEARLFRTVRGKEPVPDDASVEAVRPGAPDLVIKKSTTRRT
jgi:phytanoyl-CoA hydroxylase